jgi:hypothetical protein
MSHRHLLSRNNSLCSAIGSSRLVVLSRRRTRRQHPSSSSSSSQRRSHRHGDYVHCCISTKTRSSKKIIQVWDFPASDGQEEQKRGVLYTTAAGVGTNSMEVEKDQWTTTHSDGSTSTKTTTKSWEEVSKNALSYFLPAQYPHSVTPGYLRFASFSFTASVAGSAAMVLSTQTLLLAVGVVGSNVQQASIMAGAFNWVMKDFVGQLGGVLFASQMGKSRSFDADPKRWRMVAAMAMDGATLLEILSPLFYSSLVLPVASVANIGKNIGFLTASASRAALHQSVAITGNLGDVTAKAGSQSIVAGLIGTSVGIGLSTLLAHDTYNFAMGFCVLTVIHQGCNYISLKSVPLAYFNRQRLHLALEQYLDTGVVPSPMEIAKHEAYFPLVSSNTTTKDWLHVGSPLDIICPVPSDMNSLLAAASGESYLIRVIDGRIHLVFLKDVNGEGMIRGMLHACLLRQSTKDHGTQELKSDTTAIVQTTREHVNEKFLSLVEEFHEKGWKTGTEFTTVESSDARRLCIER